MRYSGVQEWGVLMSGIVRARLCIFSAHIVPSCTVSVFPIEANQNKVALAVAWSSHHSSALGVGDGDLDHALPGTTM